MSVRDYSPAVQRMSREWGMLTAVYGGTRTMREAGETYLPKWTMEDSEGYTLRKKQAVLFPAFKRTCGILASKPFSKPMTITGLPPALDELIEDIDAAGRGLHAFFFDVLTNCLSHGAGGVLADYPPAVGVSTVAQERAAGVRPYLVHYPAGTILGWRETKHVLRELRLLETVTINGADFKDVEIEQVRVLYADPGRWETYRKDPNELDLQKAWKLHDTGESSRNDIPFTFFYGGRTGFGTGESLLTELAYLNVEHWQSSSDQQTILHVARVPILFMRGFAAGDTLTVGSASAVRSNSPTAELKYVEHTGASIGAGRTAILDLEERMRAIGAELLVRKTNRMTATQVESEDTAGDSTLQAMVEMFELAVEQCLTQMARWVDAPVDELGVEIFNEFSVSSLSDAMANVLLGSVTEQVISKQTLFGSLKSSGVIDPELTWELEQSRIAAQPQPVVAVE